MKKFIYGSLVLGLSLSLPACLPGSDDDILDLGDVTSSLRTLTFNDASAISGLEFFNGSDNSGITNSLGQFSFDSNNPISFRIGDIDLGTISASAIGSDITAIDTSFLDSLSDGTITNKVGNITQFLQSLDDDNYVSNGITIPSQLTDVADGMNVDFGLDETTFQNENQSTVNELTSTTTAGSRDFMNRDTTDSNFQSYLDTTYGGTTGTGDDDATCVSSSMGTCTDYQACATTTEAYYLADGLRFDCASVSDCWDAAEAVVAYCTDY